MFNIMAVICVMNTQTCDGAIDISGILSIPPFETKAQCDTYLETRKPKFEINGAQVTMECSNLDAAEYFQQHKRDLMS